MPGPCSSSVIKPCSVSPSSPQSRRSREMDRLLDPGHEGTRSHFLETIRATATHRFALQSLVLSFIAIAQATLLFVIVRRRCRPPGPASLQWATLAALAITGTAVGLLISAWARSKEVAPALVPIAVIPQIICSGVVAPSNAPARFIAKAFVSVYWAEQVPGPSISLADIICCSEGTSGCGNKTEVIRVTVKV
jgi:hypothetical protein